MAITLDGTTGITSPAETVTGAVTAASVAATGAVTAASVAATGAVSGTTGTFTGAVNSINTFGFKNRIINGNMAIDQRNAGASVTLVNQQYTLDRWRFPTNQASKFTLQQNAGSVTPPAGFKNYLGLTSTSSYSLLVGDYFGVNQFVEANNTADLDWGTSNAKTITLSFWVRSSLTGTFGGAIRTGDGSNYSYPFSYTINSANTWEYKTITIPGPTTGTWGTGTSVGLDVWFSVGTGSTFSGTSGAWAAANYVAPTGATSVVGTSGATFYITGVQLEKGSTATSFDYRPYGTELALCQRYYQTTYLGVAVGTASTTTNQVNSWPFTTSTNWNQIITFSSPMRTQPTVTIYNPNSGASGSARINGATDATTAATAPTTLNTCVYSSASITAGHNVNYHYTATAEL